MSAEGADWESCPYPRLKKFLTFVPVLAIMALSTEREYMRTPDQVLQDLEKARADQKQATDRVNKFQAEMDQIFEFVQQHVSKGSASQHQWDR